MSSSSSGVRVSSDYLALLAYPETMRHRGEEVAAEVHAELTALESASLAVLRTMKQTDEAVLDPVRPN